MPKGNKELVAVFSNAECTIMEASCMPEGTRQSARMPISSGLRGREAQLALNQLLSTSPGRDLLQSLLYTAYEKGIKSTFGGGSSGGVTRN